LGLTRREGPGRSGPCRRLRAASAGWYTTIARSSFAAGAAKPTAAAGVGATSPLTRTSSTTNGTLAPVSTSGAPTAGPTGGTSASCATNPDTNARVSNLIGGNKGESERLRAGGAYQTADLSGGCWDPVDVEPRLRPLRTLPLQQRQRGVHGRRRLHPESLLRRRRKRRAHAGLDRRHLHVLREQTQPKPRALATPSTGSNDEGEIE
jgi:hypothetical protein